MTKYIEVLDRVNRDSYFELNYKLTVDLPVALQPFYNNELTTSKIGVLSCNATDTIAMIKSKLLSLWNNFNTDISSDTKWRYYGSYYDGTQWVLGGAN